MAKAAANLEIFALVLQGVLKNKEGKEEKEEEVERQRPSAQPVPESQEEAMSLEGKIALLEKNGNQGLAQR